MTELLVVIAVIAVLAAMLLPGFSRARDRARGAACQSNLKQIGLAFMLYRSDYDECYPCTGNPDLWMGRYWRAVLQGYVPGSPISSALTGPTQHSDVFLCPSDTTAPEQWERTSYAYSAAFFHRGEDVDSLASTTRGAPPAVIVAALRSIPSVVQPESAVLLPAGKILAGEWLSNHERVAGDRGWWDWRGMGHYLFADGHVKRMPRSLLHSANDGYPDPNLTVGGVTGKDAKG